jgi:alkanesulfonate monooxygenase SsuD/methylene tetrahydromethanopterin reductase-like flavin-dependent oxidoreductase (luciferase family)
MQFTFFHLMPWPDLTEPPTEWPARNAPFVGDRGTELYEDYISTMAYAERCGFDWVAANEHHFSPYSLMANCNLVGAALTQRTKSIKLAMLGNLVPLLNPIRVAEEYAMLDVMSGGRLIAGFVRGIPHEYIAYNIAPSESRQRLREALAIITKAWTEPEPFGWESEYYQFRSVSIWPRPRQKPHPRILLSATNEESAEFVGEHKAMLGMALIVDLDGALKTIEAYRSVARAHGFEPGPDDIVIMQQAVIADTDEEARALMAPALKYFHGILMRPQLDAQRIVLQKTRFFGTDAQRDHFVGRLSTLKARTLEDQIEAGSVLCGSPDSVVKQIKKLNQRLGTGHIIMNMKIGNIADSAVKHGMDLFREKVRPQVAAL